jgi:homoserine dehydrogenase
MAHRRVRMVVIGLGNVGRNFLKLLVDKSDVLISRYRLEPVVIGAADSSGIALDDNGLDLATLIRLKEQKQGVASYAQVGLAAARPSDLIERAQADMLIEMSPTNLTDDAPCLAPYDVLLIVCQPKPKNDPTCRLQRYLKVPAGSSQLGGRICLRRMQS